MKGVVETNLSNGLPLFYLKTSKAPVITLQVWVRTGSADELPNEAGLSHFIEHLVFKGTQNYQAGEIAQRVESVGGQLNAYTSFDQTVFYVTVPKEQIEVAADVLSEMVSSPLFDSVEVDNEREVVVEEIKMGLDQPSRVASRMLFSQMFEGHPYALPVIGTAENVRRVSLEEIKDYFYERYTAQNMSLVCVGDVSKDLESLLEKKFSKVLKTANQKKERSRSSRNLKADRLLIQKSEFEKNYFYLSWPVEGFLDEKSENYELLSLILGQGESSYLYKELKLKKSLCRSIGASYFGDQNSGLFVINGVAVGEELEGLFKELPKTLKNFLKQDHLNQEILKAKNIFQSEDSYAEESIASQCRHLGEDWLYYNRLGEYQERKERVLTHTEKNLKQGLEQIFSKEARLSVLASNFSEAKGRELLEQIDQLKQESIKFKDTETFVEALRPLTESSQQESFSWKTDKGNQVVFVSQPMGSVVSFKMGFQGGELLLSEDQQGWNSLLGSLWTREFEGLSEEQVNSHLDFYCSSFQAFSGRHSSGLSLTTLNSHFERLADFFAKALSKSIFSEALLEREKNSLIQKIRSRKDSPASVAFRHFSELMFQNSFYARDPLGVSDQIASTQTSDFKNLVEKIKKQKVVFSITANLKKDQVEKVVSQIEEHLFMAETDLFSQTSLLTYGDGQSLDLESEKNQSHSILAYPGLTYKSEDKLKVELLSALLGGQGGRLFIELRDKKSLAYSVAPLEFSGLYGGYFGSYIACDPTKKETALSMMRKELHKLAQEEVTPAELEWMKNQILGRQAMASQKNSYISDVTLFDSLYGKPAFSYQTLAEELEKIGSKDLQDVAAKILSGPEFRVSVGPL